jgi:acyl-CoA reductase-like NAD-dependent aldehyde dehydrogenase
VPDEDDMKPIQLISPVDGRVYAERMPLTPDAAQAAVARARRRKRAGPPARWKTASRWCRPGSRR